MRPAAPRPRPAGGSALIGAIALAVSLSTAGASAAPRDDVLMSLDQYTTAKARALSISYRPQMVELSEYLYHCVPWVEVQKGGIGFRSPRGAIGDARYLTVWVWIEQGQDAAFATMRPEQRASAMFSRYGVPLLRRMASLGGLAGDADVEGFATVLSWVKPGRARPAVNETLASFLDRTSAAELAARTLALDQVLPRVRVSLFDGTAEQPRPQLEIWEDAFLGTFALQGYTPPPGSHC